MGGDCAADASPASRHGLSDLGASLRPTRASISRSTKKAPLRAAGAVALSWTWGRKSEERTSPSNAAARPGSAPGQKSCCISRSPVAGRELLSRSARHAILSEIAPFATDKDDLRVVVETPKGNRTKYSYDPECDCMQLSTVELPKSATMTATSGTRRRMRRRA